MTIMMYMFADDITESSPVGDWRMHNLGQKYQTSTQRQDNLPFGWEGVSNDQLSFTCTCTLFLNAMLINVLKERTNTKTVEELSLSTDSTNVAVAEVNLSDLEKLKVMPQPCQACGENDTISAIKPALDSITLSMGHINSKINALESNVATILKQQEMIINLLIQQSNDKISKHCE